MVLKISDIAKEIDRDGDGQVSEEERKILNTLKEMDVDGDGEIEIGELLSLGNQMNKQAESNKNLKKIVYGVMAMSIVFCGVTFSICFAAVEAAKDAKPDDSGVTMSIPKDGGDAQPVGTASVSEAADMYATLDATPDELGALKSLTLDDDEKTLGYTITGYTSYDDRVELYSSRGDVVTIDTEKTQVHTSAGERIFSENREDTGRRRNLLGKTSHGYVSMSSISMYSNPRTVSEPSSATKVHKSPPQKTIPVKIKKTDYDYMWVKDYDYEETWVSQRVKVNDYDYDYDTDPAPDYDYEYEYVAGVGPTQNKVPRPDYDYEYQDGEYTKVKVPDYTNKRKVKEPVTDYDYMPVKETTKTFQWKNQRVQVEDYDYDYETVFGERTKTKHKDYDYSYDYDTMEFTKVPDYDYDYETGRRFRDYDYDYETTWIYSK